MVAAAVAPTNPQEAAVHSIQVDRAVVVHAAAVAARVRQHLVEVVEEHAATDSNI